MAPVTNIIKQQLLECEAVCRLCFSNADDKSIQMQDEVILSENEQFELFYMLNILLGENYTDNILNSDVICKKCCQDIIHSYQFTEMCKRNSDIFENIIDSLSNSIQNLADDCDSFKTVYLAVNPNTFESQQFYYEKQQLQNTPFKAINTLRTLDIKNNKWQENFRENKSEIDKKLKQRTRIHNYRDDILELCEVIREGNRSKYKCKVCADIFSKTYNLKKHYFCRHVEKSLKCEDCNRVFGSEVSLRLHKKNSHSEVLCSLCGKSYKNRYSLTYHMRVHSGQKPYKCEYCDKAFSWPSHRLEHVKRYHSEGCTKTCNICHKDFKSLYEHRKLHFDPKSKHFKHVIVQEV